MRLEGAVISKDLREMENDECEYGHNVSHYRSDGEGEEWSKEIS